MKQTSNKPQSSDSSHLQLSESDQRLLVDFIGGDLSQTEIDLLNSRLEKDEILAQALQRQIELDSILPIGTRPTIDSDRLRASRWSAHRILRSRSTSKLSLAKIISRLSNYQINLTTQLASVIAAFGIGFLIANSGTKGSSPDFFTAGNSDQAIVKEALTQKVEFDMLPVRMINRGDFEITNLSVDGLDRASGSIELTYSLASQTRITGNVDDPDIQGLLATAIGGDVRDATRLSLVDVLTQKNETEQIRKALSNSLLNDPNPGVRVAAAESLVKLARNSEVRKVLRKALEHDVNPGVRVEAFRALIDYSGENETQQTFKKFSVNDSNRFIREQAKKLVIL